ncbi:hypothetical protein CBS147332_8410 [Penicillium roqueforti]|nr:hypothetical protein LCP963914a_30 [Penicillium roqueforti]KAI2698618.1 hypothetical protein CBS147332_8410 [Penicillium roqueforti]KAI3125828.1 hypothetical protein CBS147331_822 [Penicillium roqueforti]
MPISVIALEVFALASGLVCPIVNDERVPGICTITIEFYEVPLKNPLPILSSDSYEMQQRDYAVSFKSCANGDKFNRPGDRTQPQGYFQPYYVIRAHDHSKFEHQSAILVATLLVPFN